MWFSVGQSSVEFTVRATGQKCNGSLLFISFSCNKWRPLSRAIALVQENYPPSVMTRLNGDDQNGRDMKVCLSKEAKPKVRQIWGEYVSSFGHVSVGAWPCRVERCDHNWNAKRPKQRWRTLAGETSDAGRQRPPPARSYTAGTPPSCSRPGGWNDVTDMNQPAGPSHQIRTL